LYASNTAGKKKNKNTNDEKTIPITFFENNLNYILTLNSIIVYKFPQQFENTVVKCLK
jgi:hypothetical protein